jgi:hypothetical protein
MDANMPTQPRQGYRPTTLNLRPDQWDRLRAIEQKTGASPSFTVRRLLDTKLLGKRRARPVRKTPAA